MKISLHSLIPSILSRLDLSHVTFITSLENILTSLSYTSLWCLQYCYMRGPFIRILFHEFKGNLFHWCVQWLHFLRGLCLSSFFMQWISITQPASRSLCKHEVILPNWLKNERCLLDKWRWNLELDHFNDGWRRCISAPFWMIFFQMKNPSSMRGEVRSL